MTRTLRSLQGSESGIPHQPVFSRKEAEEWRKSRLPLIFPHPPADVRMASVYYQDQVIKRVKSSTNHLGDTQGHLLTRRPFQVTWFSSQLAM